MRYLQLLKTFQLTLHFYRQIFLLSIFSTSLLLFANSGIPIRAVLLFKLLFFGIVFLAYFEPNLQRQLIYYKNFGLSKTVLVLISFLMDAVLTAILIFIARLF